MVIDSEEGMCPEPIQSEQIPVLLQELLEKLLFPGGLEFERKGSLSPGGALEMKPTQGRG